jgi:Cdc6-like AAA superfamily ATPase
MNAEAIIWTEGKTDWQHLKRAFEALGASPRIVFQESDTNFGDDQLVKQCAALARVAQPCPTIFMFDRDKDDIVAKVEDPVQGYKAWGNNVYSFAIPVPAHRTGQPGISVELYYTDDELKTRDMAGRRLFLSSEFNPASGRHWTDPRLSIGNKGRLAPFARGGAVRIIDSEVYDEQSQNVALSKADFARNVMEGADAFAAFRFDAFRAIWAVVNAIVEQACERIDLPFGGLESFLTSLNQLDKAHQFGAVVEAAIRICKLTAMVFAAATFRHYQQRIINEAATDAKKVRPIKQVLAESFARPSLATLHKLARYSYYLIDDRAPGILCTFRGVMAQTPILGPLGDLLDQLERVLPPPRHHVRIISKGQLKKPVLEYVLPELAKYEGREAEITDIASNTDALREADPATWRTALCMLVDMVGPVRSLVLRVRSIERVRSNSDEFVVSLRTYREGRVVSEELTQTYADLKDDWLETYELLLTEAEGETSLDLFPFLMIKADRLHYYNRTRAQGYEYSSAFGAGGPLRPTKRKFSHVALQETIAADLQGLFWTQVTPSVSGSGVKANIPAHGQIVGRKQQIATVMQEVIQIPNQNGIVYGPGGVGKTALLIEISRHLFEADPNIYFKNVIWVSAKRDYYDPTLDVVESRQPQFRSLDNILAAILEFHGFEDANGYDRAAKKWLVLGCMRDEKTLLILDNFESVARTGQTEILRFFGVEVKQALRDKPGCFTVLVTSRELIPSGFHQIELRGLDKGESKELMHRLYQQYEHSGRPQLTEEQLDALYEATRGIPLIIKHCYGQIFEYNQPVDQVLGSFSAAGSKVVDFSFAEIFQVLKKDNLQLRAILLLELIGRPLMLRQMADILGEGEADIAGRLAQLVNFQCVIRSSAGVQEKFAVNDEVRFFTRRLAQENAPLATAIKRQIASLAIEKRMDYSQEEFDALLIFQDYVAQGHYASAEDFIRERLKAYPGSLLLSLHYAKYLKEVKHRTPDAIERLEAIRVPSGNDPQVLRLLMAYYAALSNFAQAHTYARELEEAAVDSVQIRFELAQFYVAWSTAIKIKFELDPLKEILRQQQYKELADSAIKLLRDSPQGKHEWHHLLAQSYYNKWDYDLALWHVEKAIGALPRDSHLARPYRRLRSEILKKRTLFVGNRKP